jgi:putative FmdB family regulatory protein
MPVYTYHCDSCGVQFERSQKFTDNALTRCPECGKKSLRKVYTPVGIVFKGSGFYSTDHRSPSGASSYLAGSQSESKSTESKTESKTTETKTAETKTENKPVPPSSESNAAPKAEKRE